MSTSDGAFAGRVAAAMYERDRVARALEIAVDEVRFGYARCSMTVTEQMLNGHDLCHGGDLFLLADTAFAYACKSFRRSPTSILPARRSK